MPSSVRKDAYAWVLTPAGATLRTLTFVHLRAWFSRRPLLTDTVLAVSLGILVTVGTYAAGIDQTDMAKLDARAYALLWLCAAGLILRRKWPLVAVLVSFGFTMLYVVLRYPYGPIFLYAMVAIYSIAAWRSAKIATGALIFCLLAHIPWSLWVENEPDGLLFTSLTTSYWRAAPFAAGTAVRIHREAQASLRGEEKHRHIYEERLRIAQEVHDVVGHSLAVISMNAGAALHVLSKQPGPASVEESLKAIRQSSTGALDELRSTLATFTGTLSDAPNPGLELVPSLVAASEVGGLTVRLSEHGTRGHLPSTVDLAGYRIAQEALANVVRHAEASLATVTIAYSPGRVEITVSDNGVGGAIRPGGSGLESMGERARSLGGTFQAGPCDGGGFKVHAVLPFEAGKQ